MSNNAFLMFKLAKEGFCCSQIMVLMDLRERGIENPELTRALSGLCGGIGGSGSTCGVLSGGVCLLGLYGGKGSAEEEKDPRLNEAIKKYIDWFKESQGSLECREILGQETFEAMKQGGYPVNCGNIMSSGYRKLREIIEEYDFK
ncbi:MAG: C_GCAxxG_C_C family protein [Tissierellia bacterium]|nr:C_GCAxxG_C_C family protein [Tissierellia bacterium]